MAIPFSSRIVRFHTDKDGEYTENNSGLQVGDGYGTVCIDTNTPQKIDVSEWVLRRHYTAVRFETTESDISNPSVGTQEKMETPPKGFYS